MPSSAPLYGLSDAGLLFVLMAFPPVNYEFHSCRVIVLLCRVG